MPQTTQTFNHWRNDENNIPMKYPCYVLVINCWLIRQHFSESRHGNASKSIAAKSDKGKLWNPNVGSLIEPQSDRTFLAIRATNLRATASERKYPKVKLTTARYHEKSGATNWRRRLPGKSAAAPRSNKGCSHRNLGRFEQESTQAQKQATVQPIIYSKPLGNAEWDEVLDPKNAAHWESEPLRYNVYFCDAREIGPGHLPGRRSVKIKNITRNCPRGRAVAPSHYSHTKWLTHFLSDVLTSQFSH